MDSYDPLPLYYASYEYGSLYPFSPVLKHPIILFHFLLYKKPTPAMSLGPERVPVESGFDAPVKLNEVTELLNWRAPNLLQAI